MEQKRMPYRIYKRQYSDCQTLDDYDPSTKTITVIIPKRERLPVYDKATWRKTGNSYRLIADPTKQVTMRSTAGISQTFEAVWCEELTRGDMMRGAWNGWQSKTFNTRQDAFDHLLSLDQ